MTTHWNPFRRYAINTAGTGIALAALAACTSAPNPIPSPNPSTKIVLPAAHVHGMTVTPKTRRVLLATHDGLFDVTKEPATRFPATRLGPGNDFTGFTADRTDGVLLASGHPGNGSSLPDPVGLIRSEDGGQTWQAVSRQGKSDFHALTVTKSGIVAFDGSLRTSPDGRTWTTIGLTFLPAALAGHPDTDIVLATASDGVRRSTDGGKTWALNRTAPELSVAAFASAADIAGIGPYGSVHLSRDGGATWTRTGRIHGRVQAMAVVKGTNGSMWIWAAKAKGILFSADDGVSFRPAHSR